MNKDQAFALFEEMIKIAEQELFNFTLNYPVSIEHKADKSAVTACDKHIDSKLTQMANAAGWQVVSEEGEHVVSIVKSGNYLTIDPIDGTLGYIEYLNYALENGGLSNFGQLDLGAAADFCLLLGIVENSQPRFGACFNFITKEMILIDALDPAGLVRKNNVRKYSHQVIAYIDQRFINDEINNQIKKVSGVELITQAALGLKSLYTLINQHQSAVTCHRVQSAGLWDVMPAAVAAQAFGGAVYDDVGNKLKYDEYIVLPGKGATIVKGKAFRFVIDELKKMA